jgi:hypothetical protein
MSTTAGSTEETAQDILAVVTAARARWPEIDIKVEDFTEYLSAKRPDWRSDAPDDAASKDNVIDLYLVCGCLRGVAAAIRVLERQYIEPALLVANASSRRDDLRQAVLERLLLRSESGQCRLEEFSGRSPLRA